MRRFFILCACITWFYGAFAQDKKVAVFDPAGDISASTKAIIREEISNVIVNTSGYAVLERALINKVLEENKFQMSGEVDDLQIGEIGKKMGANYVFVASISPFDNNFHLSFKMIDVQTARIEKQKTGKTVHGVNDIDVVVQKIAKEMFADIIALTDDKTDEQTVEYPVIIQPVNNVNFLIVDGKNVFLQGEKLKRNEVRSLLMNTDALRLYNKGISSRKTGNTLLWSGIILAVSGSILEFSGLFDEELYDNYSGYYDLRNPYEGVGSACIVLGALSAGSGITFKILGNRNIKKAISSYNNRQYSQNHEAELHFGIVGNGIGLALKF